MIIIKTRVILFIFVIFIIVFEQMVFYVKNRAIKIKLFIPVQCEFATLIFCKFNFYVKDTRCFVFSILHL